MRSVNVSAFCLACGLAVSASSPLPQDAGAAGTWHWLQKLATTASAMHTTAHPDDEHGGLLALLSRGAGVRVSLLTLNRGESGDNALGPQLFDGLGLIRTEELAVSDRYYGVDQQYFTSVVDYGFSKRLEEAFDKWGRENVLRDVVRIIRTERPLIIVSRFQGNQRDGHGNHQTAGLLTQTRVRGGGRSEDVPGADSGGSAALAGEEAVRRRHARGRGLDGARGHRPVQPVDWRQLRQLRADRAQLSALAEWRSADAVDGAHLRLLQTVAAGSTAVGKQPDFFSGIDTTIPGLFKALGRPAPAEAPALLQPIHDAVQEAMRSFNGRDPSAIVPVLARGLAAARVAATKLQADPDATLDPRAQGRAVPDGHQHGARPRPHGRGAAGERAGAHGPGAAFAPPPVMGAVVPGQTFEVRVTMSNRGGVIIDARDRDSRRRPGGRWRR